MRRSRFRSSDIAGRRSLRYCGSASMFVASPALALPSSSHDPRHHRQCSSPPSPRSSSSGKSPGAPSLPPAPLSRPFFFCARAELSFPPTGDDVICRLSSFECWTTCTCHIAWRALAQTPRAGGGRKQRPITHQPAHQSVFEQAKSSFRARQT